MLRLVGMISPTFYVFFRYGFVKIAYIYITVPDMTYLIFASPDLYDSLAIPHRASFALRKRLLYV